MPYDEGLSGCRVHRGEHRRHLVHHPELAQSMGVPADQVVLCEDGDAVLLDEGGLRRDGTVPGGYLYVDGTVGDVGHGVLRDRRALAEEGVVIVVATVDLHRAVLTGVPQIETKGWVHAPEAEALLDEVRSAVDPGAQAEIEYHSAASDETSVRVVEPLTVVSIDGHWYLDAWCHRAEGVRRFRVDRIRALRRLEVAVTGRGREVRQPADAFVPDPGAAAVTLWLDADARWIADTVPVLAQGPGPGGTTQVVLPVGGRAWLERVLLQAGPRARVVAPPELARVGAEAAARLRQKYA